MAQGLQIFDESGNTIVDTTTRIPKFLGTFVISGKQGTYIDNALLDGELWWSVVDWNGYFDGDIEITKNGTSIQWKSQNIYEQYKLLILYGIW